MSCGCKNKKPMVKQGNDEPISIEILLEQSKILSHHLNDPIKKTYIIPVGSTPVGSTPVGPISKTKSFSEKIKSFFT